MEKISHWTWLGYIAGTIFAIGSFIRYYIIWPDVSEAITDVLLGVIIIAISWLYNENKQREYSLDAVEEYLADKKLIEENKGVEIK